MGRISFQGCKGPIGWDAVRCNLDCTFLDTLIPSDGQLSEFQRLLTLVDATMVTLIPSGLI